MQSSAHAATAVAQLVAEMEELENEVPIFAVASSISTGSRRSQIEVHCSWCHIVLLVVFYQATNDHWFGPLFYETRAVQSQRVGDRRAGQGAISPTLKNSRGTMKSDESVQII